MRAAVSASLNSAPRVATSPPPFRFAPPLRRLHRHGRLALELSPPDDAPAVLPEALRIPTATLQCFFGDEEEDTLCRDPALAGAEIIRTSGGHHFDGDYQALARRILDGARQRSGS